MPLPHDYEFPVAQPVIPERQRAEYWVRPCGDAWVISYEGDQYGPYKSRHEAMFCAVEAAHRLGEQGRDASVRLIDAGGRPVAAWVHGEDAFPPVFFLDAP
jgi:hypothetical protein